MPTLKNRTAVQLAKDLTAFLNLELGLVRGPSAPNYERLYERARRQLGSRDQELSRTRERLAETDGEAAEAREGLAEKDRLLSQARGQLAERDRQLSQAREQLAERDRRLAQAREQLAEKDRQLLEERARNELELREEEYDPDLHSDLEAVLERIPVDTGGGCSLSKAYMLAALIRRYDMKRTADIGVYRGRSLFPQALAHAGYTGGAVYGVDPWSVSEAREEDLFLSDAEREEEVNRFVEETDWQAVYREVEALREKLGYAGHCELLRCTSAEAAGRFEERGMDFDLIHIDGNHDTGKVMQDVELYLPRLRDGGFIVLDDVSFESVKPAYDELRSRLQLVFQRTDHNGWNDYAVLRRTNSPSETAHNQRFWVQDFA